MSRGFSPAAYAGFSLVFGPWMRSRISRVNIAGIPSRIPESKAIVCVANHTSWWDGFLLMELRRMLRPSAPFHTIMLESELAKSPFLRKIGAIGIDPRSPGSIRGAMIELAARIRDRPDSFVFYFPQGRIWPSRRRPLEFKAGIERFIEVIDESVVLPIAIHLEPLTKAAQSAFLSVGPLMASRPVPRAAILESAVATELDAISRFIDFYGEDSLAGWPEARSRIATEFYRNADAGIRGARHPRG